MDSHNFFATPWTYRLMRLEYAAALAVAVVALAFHLRDVHWLVFAAMFVYIDVIGYLPGAIAFRRSADGQISKVYYVLYNTMHSLVSAAVVAGLWCIFVGPEWALLALPIHLFGDRALFGNFLKPFGVSFEPSTHPLYRKFSNSYDDLQANPESAEFPTHPYSHA